MTTPAELRQLTSAGVAEAQRLVLLPASLLTTPEGRRGIAREIVALGNRDGGRVVLRDADPTIDPSGVADAIAEVATRLVSPAVDVGVELLQDGGDALTVIHVPRRAAGPLRSDAVYVRIGDRTRTASAEQVQWLERVASAAETAAVSTLRVAVRGAVATGTSAIAADFRSLFERLAADHAAALAADRERLATAYAELAPWVLLRQLDAVFADRPGARTVPLEDLAVPRHSTLAMLPGGLAGILGRPTGILARLWRRGRVGFRLPPACEPQVDVHHHRRMGRVMLAHPAWSYTFSARPADEVPSADGVQLRIERSRVLAFPQRAGESEAQADAEVVSAFVEGRWELLDDSDRGH